jgi:hypothetical protein
LWNRHKLEWGSNIGDDAGDAINYTFVAIAAAFTGAQFIAVLAELPIIAINAENIVDVAGAFYEAVSTCVSCTAEEVTANTLANFGRNKIEDGLVEKFTGAIASLYRKIPESQRKVLIDFLKQVKNKGTTEFDNVVSGTKERLRIFFKGKRPIDLIIEQIIKKNNFPKNVAEQFRRDCNEVPDLLNKFVEREELIDAWKVLDDAGVDDVFRRDANVLNAFDNAVIPNDRLIHSTVGDFTYVPGTNNISRMKSGGHGQSNLDFLDANNIEYNIINEFSNGVRVGNVPLHKSVPKRTGSNQSWFPNTWTDLDIENAGKFISSLPEFTNASDGAFIFKSFKGVEVGVIKTNGGVGTVFANSVQP